MQGWRSLGHLGFRDVTQSMWYIYNFLFLVLRWCFSVFRLSAFLLFKGSTVAFVQSCATWILSWDEWGQRSVEGFLCLFWWTIFDRWRMACDYGSILLVDDTLHFDQLCLVSFCRNPWLDKNPLLIRHCLHLPLVAHSLWSDYIQHKPPTCWLLFLQTLVVYRPVPPRQAKIHDWTVIFDRGQPKLSYIGWIWQK